MIESGRTEFSDHSCLYRCMLDVCLLCVCGARDCSQCDCEECEVRAFSKDEKIGMAVFAVLALVVMSIMFAVVP